jgi:hypothetical protein
MPWLAAEDVKALVASNQHKLPADLEDFWDPLVARATTTARGDIRRVLLERGYSEAQIESCDDLPDLHGSQATFWALKYFLATQPYDVNTRPALDDLDRRAELAEMPLTAGGLLLAPADAATQSPVGHGAMATAKVRQPWAGRRGWCGGRGDW